MEIVGDKDEDERREDSDLHSMPHQIVANRKAYRWGYVIANVVLLCLVYVTARSKINLWMWVFASAAVVAYFTVQGSDPGYLTPELVGQGLEGDVLLEEQPATELSTTVINVVHEPNNLGAISEEEIKQADDTTQQTNDEDDELDDTQSKLKATPCPYCNFVPPIRSHHCKTCNRCVATFDHHCFVIGTCIGERNHCRFWWFIFLQTAALWDGVCVVGAAFKNADSVSEWGEVNKFPLLASFVLYVFLIYSAILFGYQTWLMLSSMTGYECVRGPEKLWYLSGTEDFDLPFSKGLCSNVASFCWRDGCAWMLSRKRWTRAAWKPPGRIDRDSEDVYNHCWQNKYWSCC